WMNINSIESLVERRASKGHVTISELFNQYFALSVPKARYLPVKTTTNLFLLKSDLYTFTDGTLTRNTARENPDDPYVELGPEFEN
ncbi:UTP--glucose-1-phosphate uridylyltransferase 1, partial [Striga hermonthica]